MENMQQFIKPELLVIVPVLYIIGLMLKNAKVIEDKFIPLIIGIIGIVLALIYVIATSGFGLMAAFVAVTQGILCAGAAVYVNQLTKQITKG